MSDLVAQRRRGRLYVALAALAWSTAGLLQRELTLDVATQLAGRAFFAVIGVGATSSSPSAAACGGVLGDRRRRAGDCRTACRLVRVVLHRAQLHIGRERPLHAGARADPRCAARDDDRRRVSRRTWIAMAVALAGVSLMVGGRDGRARSGSRSRS